MNRSLPRFVLALMLAALLGACATAPGGSTTGPARGKLVPAEAG